MKSIKFVLTICLITVFAQIQKASTLKEFVEKWSEYKSDGKLIDVNSSFEEVLVNIFDEKVPFDEKDYFRSVKLCQLRCDSSKINWEKILSSYRKTNLKNIKKLKVGKGLASLLISFDKQPLLKNIFDTRWDYFISLIQISKGATNKRIDDFILAEFEGINKEQAQINETSKVFISNSLILHRFELESISNRIQKRRPIYQTLQQNSISFEKLFKEFEDITILDICWILNELTLLNKFDETSVFLNQLKKTTVFKSYHMRIKENIELIPITNKNAIEFRETDLRFIPINYTRKLFNYE